jgi:phenylalanyl-tRNA synthetase beta chain
VHPLIREACDINEEVFYCELDARLLVKLMIGVPAPTVSDYPAVWRDMTLKVGAKEQASRVLRFIQEASLDALTETLIVDDFRRPEEDFRRVTYRVIFQRPDRTLKSEEVDSSMGTLLESLKGKHGIEMAS